jgi:hypothetical protein
MSKFSTKSNSILFSIKFEIGKELNTDIDYNSIISTIFIELKKINDKVENYSTTHFIQCSAKSDGISQFDVESLKNRFLHWCIENVDGDKPNKQKSKIYIQFSTDFDRYIINSDHCIKLVD